MHRARFTILLVLALTSVCSAGPIPPTTPPRDLSAARAHLLRGNQALASGDPAAALEAYASAAATWPEGQPFELVHNRAIALFRTGAHEAAGALWQQARAAAGDAQQEAIAVYNLGTCTYNGVLAELAAAPPGAPERCEVLRTAVTNLGSTVRIFREAVLLDPTLEDTRANLELAAQLRTALQAEYDENCQQESEPAENGDESPEEREQQEEQQEAGDSEQSAEEDPSGGAQPDENQQQHTEQETPEQQESESGQAGEDGAPQPGDANPKPTGSPGEAPESPDGGGTQSQDEPGGTPEDSPPPGEAGTESPDPSAGDANPADADGQQGEAAEPPGDAPDGQPQTARPIQLTPEQAERLLQLVRDAERARRAELARRQAARQPPVERDW